MESAELPPLPLLVEVAHLHHELVLGSVDRQAFPTTSVAECPSLRVTILPELDLVQTDEKSRRMND